MRTATRDNGGAMSPVERREQVREYVLHRAEADSRITAAAIVGSLAQGPGDQWSDLDLTFGVARDASVGDVLADWTRDLVQVFDATPLLDVVSGDLFYRVFLLSDWVQVDLSFARESARQTGSAFQPLYGPFRVDVASPPAPDALFRWACLYARHAHVAISRGQGWHAEYCIGRVREHALTLACVRRNLPATYGKGFDRLPCETRTSAEGALVGSLEREELCRVLAVAVAVLLREAVDVDPTLDKVRQQLAALVAEA